VVCVVAKYGLQLEAKEEGIFNGDEWSDSDCNKLKTAKKKFTKRATV